MEPGASEVPGGLEKPPTRGEGVTRTEILVGKPVSWLPRKAAIVYHEPVP